MNEEINDMINDCVNRQSKLSEWEVNFISDITEQYESTGGLSKKQAERLEEIWDRVTR